MLCGLCGYNQPEGNRFCEECGVSLLLAPVKGTVQPNCPHCGAGPEPVDTDGFCTHCGHERRPSGRDRFAIRMSGSLAGVSDRGKVHTGNEDYFALAADAHGDVLVVCDGVSSAHNAALASEVAAKVVCSGLLHRLRRGLMVGPDIMRSAFKAGHAAIFSLPRSPGNKQSPPDTTIVAAVHHAGRVSIGWLGDSRAYLLTPAGSRLLTEDHSWVNEVVAAGQMTRLQANRAPLAHAITRSLGGSSVPEPPSLYNFELPPGPGFLLLCSDGLWNCVPEANRLLDLLQPLSPGDALAAAQRLVDHARDLSGHDNITATLLAIPAASCVDAYP